MRIIAQTTSFAGMADAALNQIRQYGSKSVAVVLRLLETLAKVAPHLRRETDRAVLLEHARKIRADGCAQVQNESDRAEIEERFALAENALEKSQKPVSNTPASEWRVESVVAGVGDPGGRAT